MTYHNGVTSASIYAKHPFLYRGYYFDWDLSFYRLGTRYYDPEIRRFISADNASVTTATPMSLTDKNLYAYCDNNPVMRVDYTGEFWLQLGIGAALGLVGGIIDHINSGEDFSFKVVVKIVVSTAAGAASAVVGPAAGAFISGIANGVNSALSGNDTDKIMTDALFGAGVSLVGSGVQLAVGRVLAGNAIKTASKTQLKMFANSLGYIGRNFKSSSSWTGKIMFDASKQFMKTSLAQGASQGISFTLDRIWSSIP